MGMRARLVRGPRIAMLILAPKQCIGSASLRRHGIAVADDPGYFHLQQGDPLGQLALRIGGEILARQAGGGVGCRAGAGIVLHATGIVSPRALAVNDRAR